MRTNFLFILALLPSVTFFAGCGEDTPPEKSVGSITFVVSEENTLSRLSGVLVSLVSDEDPSFSSFDRTDDAGRCVFTNVPVGTYHMNLSKPGYDSRTDIPLRINAGDNPSQDISLKRTPTVLTVSPSELDFGDNESVVQKRFSLVNPNYEELKWAVLDTDIEWIVSVCDMDGKKNGKISYNEQVAMSVTINRDKLANGPNESTIVILSDNGSAELRIMAQGADRRVAKTNVSEVTEYDMTSAVFVGKMISEGSPKYEKRGFVYSTESIEEDATDGFIKLPAEVDYSKDEFSKRVEGLNKGTTYYVRAYADNPIGFQLSSNQVSFTTIVSLTSVKTLPVDPIDVANGIVYFNGEITSKGDPEYSEKGFCYNDSGEPTISDKRVTVPEKGSGPFQCPCSEFAFNKTYYVRAYAIQGGTVYYGSSEPFILEKTATEVSTSSASNVKATTATLNGTIIKIGSPAYTEKGFCYSYTTSTPTINSIKKEVKEEVKEGSYTANVTNLSYDKEYYYRAYAIQGSEPIYGSIIKFEPKKIHTEVSTSGATDVTPSSATLNGSIIASGDPVYTEKGFCYSTGSSPTVNDTKITVGGTGSGDYSATITGLTHSSNYYYRAYAIQESKPIYGEIILFNSGYVYASIETLTADSITENSATVYYTIRNSGDPKATEAGVCYGTGYDPTIDDSKIKGNVNYTLRQSAQLSNLEQNTTYYYRAYIIQEGKPLYGNSLSFKTYYPPKVSTYAVSSPQNPSGLYNTWQAQLSGCVVDVGYPAITQRGFVYTTAGDPMSGGTSIKVSGSSIGDYYYLLTGLYYGTTYYVRAYVYVKDTKKTYYGEIQTFTPGN